MKIKSYDYIKITDKKVPTHSLEKSFKYEEVENEPNLAVLVKEPYVVLDFDNNDHFYCMCEIIKELNIRCRVMATDRGGHVWFKSATPLVNKINCTTAITLKTDIKSWGSNGEKGNKKSMVTVKKNGVWREWLKEDENIDELPFWLMPVKTKKDLYGFKDGDGRDSELFSYIIPLLKQGFDKAQIRYIFTMINEHVFEEPLKDAELEKMFTDNDVFHKKDLYFFDNKKFKHNLFADWLKESYFFKSYGNQVYLYQNGLYIRNNDEILRKMIEQIPDLTKANMAEAFENLRLKVTSHNETIDPYKINVKNGLYDLENDCFIEHSPYVFSVNQLNCEYKKDAYCKDVDVMLDSLTQDNKNIRKLLEQLLGYILINDCRCQKAFILLGNGSNGKSKFLEMIMNWLGYDNCSSLALEDLSDKFRTHELVGKIANIGDDSGGDLLRNTAIFKKIVAGDSITIEQKYGNPFSFKNTSKLIFSANNLPPSTDKSDGFFRRMVIIPFNAIFKPGAKYFDPNIIDKVTTEEAKSYLLNIAIKNALMIIKKGFIDIPEEATECLVTYEKDNNNALQFIEDNYNNIEGRSQQAVYTDYCLYCSSCNSVAVQMMKFNKEIMKRIPTLHVKHVIDNGVNKWIWSKKERL